ncbi:hypothetical protein GH714_023677 [Hevea brasiliensis]|uniref:AAA+ ATPase domain-containing protein n=1 Tax=Hevea brasiliensis TaxID=3981 RepID=A0A6A6KR22_HEVBR|nr:hypothetical protein GH714_023677 [Hevea brasiliensis]
MDKSPDGEGPTTLAAAAEEIQQRGSSRISRRLVQSTLFPHKSPVIESKDDQKDDKECNGEVKDGDDEQCCGSQGKKKRTRKRKESPQTKTPKVSRRAKKVSSAEATPEKDTTSKKPKGSSINSVGRKNATPKKNGQENSRVFGGKQMHPFFLSQNVGKIGHKTAIERKPRSISIGPIHVFERDQDDAEPLDWRDWKFCEKLFANSSFTPESSFSSIFECTVKSLSFDEFPSVLHPIVLPFQDNTPLVECLPQQELLYEASATAMSSGPQVECYQLIKDAETDYQVDEVGLLSGCVRKSDADQQSKIQQERMSSHLGCANQPDNRLWTNKYQPKKAMEICGNDDSVKFLNEWLCTWHQRSHETSKASSVADECYMHDPDYKCSQNDSDSENISEEASFKNVLLITGLVGSGKSAAIYACAKEQGFRVLEVNTSECRNGAAVKERFGVLDSQSTLDSQLLQWSQESTLEFQIMDIIKPPAAHPNGKMVQEIDSEVIEVISIADEDISHEATETFEKVVYKDSSVACGQGQLKPLILFEDVDVIFSEDRGFISAIQQISGKVKWPVILTTNSDKPVLPDNLDRLELCFKRPLEKELFQHLYMVCSAEKANVQPHLVEQLIEFCQRDMRKIIMHLQFWCQGEQFRKGNEVRRLFSPMPFDLEDGYQILPKMIPWDFPSQLSEVVEKEITMSLCMMEENGIFTEVIEDKFDDKDVQNNLEKHIYEIDSIEAKKKVMLSKNCFDHDCIDFIASFNPACGFFDSSNSTVPFSQKSHKRKLVVMSSDSEDDRLPTSPDKDIINEFSLEKGEFASHHPSMQKGFSPSTELQLFSETAVHLNVKDTCISVDMSCVPESSYVPETEIDDGTKIFFGRLSCDQVGQQAEVLEEASVSNEFRQSILPVDANNFDESMPKLYKDSDLLSGTCDAIAVIS